MKNGIGHRLKEFIDRKKMQQEEIAEILNLPKQQISSWTTGTTNITTKYLPQILQAFPDLDARWLLTGLSQSSDYDQSIAKEPMSPYTDNCTNPICIERIKYLSEKAEELMKDKVMLMKDKEFLQEQLSIRRAEPPENKVTGGVGQFAAKAM
jgi:transcriptional regulator with XRE-family HTH domain